MIARPAFTCRTIHFDFAFWSAWSEWNHRGPFPAIIQRAESEGLLTNPWVFARGYVYHMAPDGLPFHWSALFPPFRVVARKSVRWRDEDVDSYAELAMPPGRTIPAQAWADLATKFVEEVDRQVEAEHSKTGD